MGVNRVDYGGNSLIDLTQDSVTPSVLLSGYTAHNKSGELITGTAVAGEGGDDVQFGVCESAGNEQHKVATIIDSDENWRLKVGMIIAIKFTYNNSYASSSANPTTLNVNGTGDIVIYYNVGMPELYSTDLGCANRYTYYTYDGVYWVWLGHGIDNNTAYPDMSQTVADTGTDETKRTITAKVLHNKIIGTPTRKILVNPSTAPTEDGSIWITT